MKTKLISLLISLAIVILAIIFFVLKAEKLPSSDATQPEKNQLREQLLEITPPPPQVFTTEQAATIMEEIGKFGDGEPRSKEEKQYDQKIMEKYYDSAPKIMALFPTVEEEFGTEKSALLYILVYKKDGRKDIVEFLEKTLSQDLGILKTDGWVEYALSYMEQWDVPSAVRVAPRILTLKYEPYEGGNSTGAARPMAIRILERHGGEKELEPLTQFMTQREKEFGDQDLLYRYARRAVIEIKSRLAKENPKPSQ